VAAAAERRAPHLICDFVEEVAGAVNSWYHAGNLDPSLRVVGVPEELSRSRLVLARAVQIVLRNGLTILGVSAPARMDRDEVAA
jgi:arginyl-tRNA synthetase